MRPPYTGGKTERYSSGADDRADAMRDAIRNTSDQIQVTGTCYYISYRGDDSADGLNPETAVRNIEEIRARASIPFRVACCSRLPMLAPQKKSLKSSRKTVPHPSIASVTRQAI